MDERLVYVPKGTYCLTAWAPSGDCPWGHSCDRADQHLGRHRCRCGSTRMQRPGDPEWSEEELDG